jgi:hypothetical protein
VFRYRAQGFDEEGYDRAACGYFIEAAAYYSKAKVAPFEIEALQRSLEGARYAIAKLGC